ncbi:MAG TPA: hypothetical protein VJL86_05035 [Steroidobacteraceae bacterium]|nr:hypothetical protein [Steroidobacteraceae bacterium]
MRSFMQPGRAGLISATAFALVATAPFTALAQTKPPNVTVVNPVSSPVNTRITNTVVPVEVSNADAIPVQDADAGTVTHVGQKPSRLVYFYANRDSSGRYDPQSGSAPSFAVPAGHVVVLTDFEMEAPCSGDDLITLDLKRHFPGGSTSVLIRHTVQCTLGFARLERHYTTGLVVGAGQFFRADAYELIGNEPTGSVSSKIAGYLVPED